MLNYLIMRNLFYKFSKQCKLSFLILMLFALSPLNGNAAVVVNSASELLSYLLSISQNSAEIFDGKVVVNWNISVPDMIKIPLGSNITIESRRHLNATIEVDGGTLSFVGDNAYGSSLCNVILQSGTLKLQKASSDPCISTATVNGGNIQQEGGGTVGATLVQELIINAEASIKGCLERSSISYPLCKKMLVAASANNVSIQDSYISEYLEISGDATLNNVCCDETLINSGTVSIQNFYGARIGHGTITQKGGTVSMYDVFSLVLVEGGELTIDSTPWLNTGKDLKDQTCSPVVHLKGDNAKVLFMNGTHFDGNAINALGGYAVRLTKGELEITKNLVKVSDALDDIVPICVFGNYSSGKSTFINALIGREVLPSGGDPVTAKAFKIQNSSQTDVARIKFTHWGEVIELSFEDDSYRVIKGDVNDKLLLELDSEIKEKETMTMNQMVSVALEFINAYEKRDSSSTEIGNMIELYIAFSKTGILGSSNNKFVIFDTPGSNTATNDGHIEVLKEALEGFSNGIPVWVSQYEAIDTMDNEALCNNILNIDALDKRFTMIVLNKADVSDLPEKEFNEKQVKNIKEFKSVEKMYASGIFFVSSIMGLGAKNDGILSDKYYRKIYKLQKDSFTDPDDEDYMQLYKYNIMPLQIKEEVIAYAANEKNIVYVNSGLHCVETEIEEFASKYSAYNKCQMVNALLTDVVDKTTEKIEKRVQERKKLREKYRNDLEEKKQQLINTMRDKSVELDANFSNAAYQSINTYSKTHLDYNYPLEDLEKLNKKYIEENTNQYHIEDKKKDLDEAKGKMFSDLKGRVKDFSFSDLKGSFSGIVEDAKKGVESIQSSQKELELTQKNAASETVNEVLEEVINTYKANMLDATKKINHIAFSYWENNTKLLKDELISIVTASDALTDKQKQTLSELIFNYKNITYDDNANAIFVKPKFLQGHLLGLDLFMFERLNVKKLEKEYNKTVVNNIESIANDLNTKYYNSYQQWQEELSMMIEQNIVELNPQLQVMFEQIANETEGIIRLETSQQKIRTALSEIENLISFKTIE